jgi:hypothetical protein
MTPPRFARVVVADLCVLFLVALGGCYEIPPRQPSVAYRVPVGLSGAYVANPFHPASLWFQRAFAPRDGQHPGEWLDPASALPSPPRFGLADYAELLSLLELFDDESIWDPVRRAVFRADALALASRLPSAPTDPELTRLHQLLVVQLIERGLAPLPR